MSSAPGREGASPSALPPEPDEDPDSIRGWWLVTHTGTFCLPWGPRGATNMGLQILARGRTQRCLGPRAVPQRGAQNASHRTGHGTGCQSDSRCARCQGCAVRRAGSPCHPEEDAGAVQVVPSSPRPRCHTARRLKSRAVLRRHGAAGGLAALWPLTSSARLPLQGGPPYRQPSRPRR